jgi:hypothetical protein
MNNNLIKHVERNYLPPDEQGAYDWGGNFNEELPRFAGLAGVTGTEQALLTATYGVLTYARKFKRNASDVYHERIRDYQAAAWSTMPLTIRPFTSRLNLATNEASQLGYFQAAIPIADRFLKIINPPADMLSTLRLNPLPKHIFDLAEEAFAFTKLDNLVGVTTAAWEKRHSDAAVFKYREPDTEPWHLIGTYLRSPATLPIPAHNKPREVEIIGRYVKANDEVGHWSQPVRLTIWPVNEG